MGNLTEEPSLPVGKATAARLNIGSDKGILSPLSLSAPERDRTQYVSVTVVLYNTITGGVPSQSDVKAAIDDMEELYAKCTWSGKLDGKDDLSDEKAWNGNSSEAGAAFMKEEKSSIQSKHARFSGFPVSR